MQLVEGCIPRHLPQTFFCSYLHINVCFLRGHRLAGRPTGQKLFALNIRVKNVLLIYKGIGSSEKISVLLYKGNPYFLTILNL